MDEKIVETKSLAIEIKGSKTYIEYENLTIKEGDYVLVCGKNGAGKSTFFNMFQNSLFDYFVKTRGELIYYDNNEPTEIFSCPESEKAHLRRKIVIIDQKDDYEKSDSGYDVLIRKSEIAIKNEFDRAIQKNLLKQMRERSEELFNEYLKDDLHCKFKEFKLKKVSSWSGGQIKMIHILSGILKAELMKSRLLLMDEPLNNLDKEYKLKVNRLLQGLMATRMAILVITHCHVFEGINRSMIYAKETANRCIVKIGEEAPQPNLKCLAQLKFEMEE